MTQVLDKMTYRQGLPAGVDASAGLASGTRNGGTGAIPKGCKCYLYQPFTVPGPADGVESFCPNVRSFLTFPIDKLRAYSGSSYRTSVWSEIANYCKPGTCCRDGFVLRITSVADDMAV